MNESDNPILEVKNLSYQIGGRVILNNLNLTVRQGEFIAILGPNGAGKSTFLKLILGLIKPTSGTIQIFGNTPKTGNNQIGYTPQHRELESVLALRAKDIVGFGFDGNKWGFGLPNKRKESEVNKVLKEVNAISFAESPISKLSGGEQQRLLIAQALITSPKLFLLDEPLSNLDPSSASEIVNLISGVTKSRAVTVLFVTHDINPLLGVVDRVLYLANGKSEIGSADKVITTEILTKLYGSPIDVIKARGKICVIGEVS